MNRASSVYQQLLGESQPSDSKEFLLASAWLHFFFFCSRKNCPSVPTLLIAGGERGVVVCGRHLIFCLIAPLMGRKRKMSLT